MRANRIENIKYLLSFFRVLILTGFLVGLASIPCIAAQLDTGLGTALVTMGPDETVSVIIIFADKPAPPSGAQAVGREEKQRRRAEKIRSLRSAADAHRRQVRDFLSMPDASSMRSLWLINGLAAKLKRQDIRRLADMPGVEEIQMDRVYRKKDLLQAIGDYPEPNIAQAKAPELWALGQYGQGTTVGLMDSGADKNHPDLNPTWRGGTNSWFDPYGEYAAPFDSDPDGHGTAVLGIMVGQDLNPYNTTIGMAPKARWIAARLFDSAGDAYSSGIHAIFQWFLDPDGNSLTDDAPDIINGSWGIDPIDPLNRCLNEFQADIAELNAAGIATVFAAGNYGPNLNTSVSPANYPEVIAVGAIDGLNQVVLDSARGPGACDGRIYPDVVAPGLNLTTTDKSTGGFLNYKYDASGTSVAAPHVSGGLALLAGAFPDATLTQLKTAVLASSDDLGFTGADNDYGNGRINVDASTGAFVYLRDTVGLTPCVRPDIGFSTDLKPAAINAPITFTATVDGGLAPLTYDWDFNGDGTVDDTLVDSPLIQHTYANAYTGSIGLTVTDASGCSSELIVADQWACPSIAATIRVNTDPILAGQPVIFINAVFGGVEPYSYAWDFNGDGAIDATTDSITAIQYTYSSTFTGNVTLTVTDSTGCKGTGQLAVDVQQAPAPSSNGSSGSGCFIGTVALPIQ